MVVVKIAILALLMLVFAQDMRSRSVYWFLFPVLIVLFMVLAFYPLHGYAWQPVLVNMSFLLLQFLLVSFYFSVKNARWVNITAGLLGWGDVLFLLSIAFYLSVLNFLFFYLGSLVCVLLCWLVFPAKHNKEIPLAGLQALIFSFFLITAWWIRPVNVTSDDWLLQLIAK